MPFTKIMPPTYLLLAIVLMVGLHFLCPVARWMPTPSNAFGVLPISFGLAVNLWADRRFKQTATTVKPGERSRSLVTTGPFRFSRHPMYVGMIVLVLGVAVVLGTVTPLGVIAPFAWVMHAFARFEERSLEGTFGEEYRRYAGRTRRWL